VQGVFVETLLKKLVMILGVIGLFGTSCSSAVSPRPDSLVSYGEVAYKQYGIILTIHGSQDSIGLPFAPRESWRVPGGVFYRGEWDGLVSGVLVEGGTLNLTLLPGSYDAYYHGNSLYSLGSGHIYRNGMPWLSLEKPADRFFSWGEETFFLRNQEDGRWNRMEIREDVIREVPFPVGIGEIIPFNSVGKLVRWNPKKIEILGETGWEKLEEFDVPMDGYLTSPEGAVLVVYNQGFMEVLFIGEDRLKAGVPPGEPPYTLLGAGESLLFYAAGILQLDLNNYETSPYLP
jgi:hypothetical protein